MKNLIEILLFTLLATLSTNVTAQVTIDPNSEINPINAQPRGTNMIACADYESIEFNGYRVGQINNVNGDYVQLWGQPDSSEDHEGVGKSFYYGNNSIGFNSDGYTSGISIESSQWPITVLGKEIRVGDSFTELKQKFGNDLKIIHKPVLGPEYTVSFNCSGNDYDGVHINFNPITHKVEVIRYFVNT